MLFVAKSSRLNPPSHRCSQTHVLHPSSRSTPSKCCRMPEPYTWDRNLQSWQTVLLPCRSTSPLAQNTACMFRMGDGRRTFTIMLQWKGFAFPPLLGAFSSQISFFSALPAPMRCLHAAAALQPSPARRGSWCCNLNGKAARKRGEQALTAARQPR